MKSMYSNSLKTRRSFEHHASVFALALLFAGLPINALAVGVNLTWTGNNGNQMFSTAQNWATDTIPNDGNIAYFDGSGMRTRFEYPETIVLNSAAGSIGLTNGVLFHLTSNQTTSVILNADSTFSDPVRYSVRFYGTPIASGTSTDVRLDAGSGSFIMEGDPHDGLPIQVVIGAASTQSVHQFLNNNAPGESVIKFGSDVVFIQGGSQIRQLLFDGTGDNIFNGRILFASPGATITKRGSGMLTLGGDSTDRTTDMGTISISSPLTTNNLYLEQGTLNINNSGAVGTGTVTISGGVTINNTSGTAIETKNSPRIAINGDFVFAGSNDLSLGSGTVALAGPARTITVSAGRLGLGGAILGTNIGITLNGSGTLALGGNSASYTGTTKVTSGAVLANGSIRSSLVTVASGAAFGGSGTVGRVIMEAGTTLRPGDLALVMSDTLAWTSGSVFSGTIRPDYSVMKVDKSIATTGTSLTLKTGVELEFAIGRGVTNTKVRIDGNATATTPSIAFNNNHIKIKDLTGGAATPGWYPLFVSGTGSTFDTVFKGLTADSAGNILTGLSVEAPLAYSPPNYGYRLMKKDSNTICFRLFGKPEIICEDRVVAVQDWHFYMPIELKDMESKTVSTLPSGLFYDLVGNHIYIHGAPTVPPGMYNVTITATNLATTVTKTIVIEVKSQTGMPAPVFKIDELLLRPPGIPFSYVINVDNFPESITPISVLPTWLTLAQDSITGIWTISGTPPPGGGEWPITLKATNTNGNVQTTLTVISAASTQPPVIIGNTNATGAVNSPFYYKINASNNPAYFGITGTLPIGAAFDPHTGVFSGNTTVPGTSTVTIHAINTSGTGSALLEIQVLGTMASPEFTSTNSKIGYLNEGFSHTFAATPYISAIVLTGASPPWLSYDPLTYTISGTCSGDADTWALSGTTWPIAVKATNAVGFATQTFDLVIKRNYPIPTITTPKRAECFVGKPYAAQITVNTTVGLEGYSQTGLPPGLLFDPLTGSIAGTPTTAGTYVITYGATTSGGTGTKQHTLTVVAVPPGSPFITSASTHNGIAGQPIAYQITTETPATTYSAKNLPKGLSIHPTTGLISGTPEVGGYYSVTIKTSNGAGDFETTIVFAIAPANSTLVTYAGTLDVPGHVNASGTDARFNKPSGAVINISGTIYVTDLNNNAIRVIATDGMVSDYVSGVAKPASIAVDSVGNIYYADVQNNCIKQVLASDKTVWTIASGVLAPGGVAIDAADNIYFSDTGNNIIKKISASDGSITVFAGSGTAGATDGTGAAASFYAPSGLVYDRAGNVLYVADMLNNTLRAINIATRAVTTIAGAADDDEGNIDGKGSVARFRTPEGLAIDKAGFVYIADTGNSTIRVCDPKTGLVITLIGVPQQTGPFDGNGVTARMNLPSCVIIDSAGTGDIYIVDTGNNAIRTLLSAPYIASALVSTTIAAGSSITLDGGAWGAPIPTYAWYKDGVPVGGAKSRTLALASVKTSDAGTYQVVASNVSGTVNSAMQLTVTTSGGGDGGDSGGGGGSTSFWFLVAIAGLAGFRRIFERKGESK